MKGYIYKYTFPDGKVYIGQTRRDPEIRHREHISPVTGPTNGGFWKAYTIFHECKFEIIHQFECDDIEKLVGMLNYAESFGLVVFVYALGLQVGPGFFSSFLIIPYFVSIFFSCT